MKDHHTQNETRLVRSEDPDLTPEESRRLTDNVKEHIAGAGDILWTIYVRKGWKALGYTSWTDYRDAEFSDMSKSNFYRLLTASKVSQTVGLPVAARHAAILDKLPVDLQSSAYQKAVEIAGENEVTSEIVEGVVEEIAAELPEEDLNTPKASASSSNSSAASSSSSGFSSSAPETPDERSQRLENARTKWDRSLARLREVCGAKLAKAIEAKAFEHLKDGDILTWVHDDKGIDRGVDAILAIERLVTGGDRMTVRQALATLGNMPDERTRLSHMHNLAIAGGGGTLASVGGASHASVSACAPKRFHQALAELIEQIQER